MFFFSRRCSQVTRQTRISGNPLPTTLIPTRSKFMPTVRPVPLLSMESTSAQDNNTIPANNGRLFDAVNISVADSNINVSAVIDGAFFDEELTVSAWANLWFNWEGHQSRLLTVNGVYDGAGRVDIQFPRVLQKLSDDAYEAHVLVQAGQGEIRDASGRGRYRGGAMASGRASVVISVVDGKGSKCLPCEIRTYPCSV